MVSARLRLRRCDSSGHERRPLLCCQVRRRPPPQARARRPCFPFVNLQDVSCSPPTVSASWSPAPLRSSPPPLQLPAKRCVPDKLATKALLPPPCSAGLPRKQSSSSTSSRSAPSPSSLICS
jgi:hypothetical protein